MGIRLTKARLVLDGIDLVGFHGQADMERRRGNRFRVDLIIEGDLAGSLASDSLEDTVDYGRVVSVIRDVNREKSHLLIESLAEAIASALFARFPRISRLSLRVAKLRPPGLGGVSSAAIELVEERE